MPASVTLKWFLFCVNSLVCCQVSFGVERFLTFRAFVLLQFLVSHLVLNQGTIACRHSIASFTLQAICLLSVVVQLCHGKELHAAIVTFESFMACSLLLVSLWWFVLLNVSWRWSPFLRCRASTFTRNLATLFNLFHETSFELAKFFLVNKREVFASRVFVACLSTSLPRGSGDLSSKRFSFVHLGLVGTWLSCICCCEDTCKKDDAEFLELTGIY